MIPQIPRREDNQIYDVSESVKWIGVLDYDIVTFDVVMTTEYGTTYNSYFINAEKKTIIETTKDKFWDVYEAKIKKLCDPKDLQYIVLNHTEPDHSGNLSNLLRIAPNATVVGTGQAIRYLNDLLGFPFKHIVVKDGDVLSLGNLDLKFISAPNLHWPDTMYTWLEKEGILFTCDSFGSHYCHPDMYDHAVGNFDDAFKYYFDVILKPYSKFMLKAIDKIKNLNIKAVATGHGPLLTSQWQRYVELSKEYAQKALEHPLPRYIYIPYVSAYQKTGKAANAIADGIKEVINDAIIDIQDIEHTPIGELEEKISRAEAIIVGSTTINQNTLLPIYKLFSVINPIRDKGKIGGCFGSYGWSGEASKIIYDNLKNLKLQMHPNSFFYKFTLHEEQIEEAKKYGKEIAQMLLNNEKFSSA